MLKQCGYDVFLDQFVLVPGQGVATQLGRHLSESASGVLVWSTHTEDSKWVENEYDTMASRKNDTSTEFPFYFVVASLDGQKPPALQGGQLYIDFSDYPDGPMGADLVRLTCGLQGRPLSEAAVGRVVAFEQSMREESANLRAMAKAEMHDEIAERATSEEPAFTTSATLPALATDLLIRAKRYSQALRVAENSQRRFPSSLRLHQLCGLALRRNGQLQQAVYRMSRLLEEGERDPESLGILAAAYADRWQEFTEAGNTEAARDALEHARELYREGFIKVPTDTYTGINAASKSALLGDMATARSLAGQVLERLQEEQDRRGDKPPTDYWQQVTEPEALLLCGDWDRACQLYHEARIAHQHESGSIESTGTQLRRLLDVLDVPSETDARLRTEFDLH